MRASASQTCDAACEKTKTSWRSASCARTSWTHRPSRRNPCLRLTDWLYCGLRVWGERGKRARVKDADLRQSSSGLGDGQAGLFRQQRLVECPADEMGRRVRCRVCAGPGLLGLSWGSVRVYCVLVVCWSRLRNRQVQTRRQASVGMGNWRDPVTEQPRSHDTRRRCPLGAGNRPYRVRSFDAGAAIVANALPAGDRVWQRGGDSTRNATTVS